MALYVATPLLGGLAGMLGMMGVTRLDRFLLWVAMGTLYTTSVVWVAVDPVVGLIEMLVPASRRHRMERLAQAEAQRRARQEKREHLLAEAIAREERDHQQWRQKLHAQAQKLATLLVCDANQWTRAEQEAVDIGAEAWRLGGLSCMRQLHEMAIQAAQERESQTQGTRRRTDSNAILQAPSSSLPSTPCDYLSYWWDGIGDWRKPSLG